MPTANKNMFNTLSPGALVKLDITARDSWYGTPVTYKGIAIVRPTPFDDYHGSGYGSASGRYAAQQAGYKQGPSPDRFWSHGGGTIQFLVPKGDKLKPLQVFTSSIKGNATVLEQEAAQYIGGGELDIDSYIMQLNGVTYRGYEKVV